MNKIFSGIILSIIPILAYCQNNAPDITVFGCKIGEPLLISELNDKQIIDIKCGERHCLALSECGNVYAWGYGKYGQIGNNNKDNQLTPFKIPSFNSIKIKSISCGAYHCLALSLNGDIYGWGRNRCGPDAGRRDYRAACAHPRASR